MSNPWTIADFPSTAAQATASQAAPAAAGANGQVTRLRAMQISISAAATAQTPIQWMVRDGDSGGGAILMTGALAAPADSVAAVNLAGLDLRASPGNALTVEFAGAGVSGSQASVSAQGDFIPQGYPMFQS